MMVGYRRTRPTVLIGLAAFLMALAGCQSNQAIMNQEHLGDGLVIVLPGTMGRGQRHEEMCQALVKEKGRLAVQMFDWTAPLGPVFNQCAVEHNRAQAAKLAARIVEYRKAHPGGRVYLIAHSGGTAIAVWAAEALGDGEKVDGIIMLASSLSPGYDLSDALRRSRNGIVSFYSAKDWVLLGLGAVLFGTMDRQYTEAAGLIAFQAPAGADAQEGYDKLFQVAWEARMAEAGNDGGHFGPTAAGFVATYVAPFVNSMSWDRSLVARVLAGREIEVASARVAPLAAN